MIVPTEFELFDRYIQVRDPYTRLESIYHYLHDPQNYSQWGAKFARNMDFTEFLVWLANFKLERASVAWVSGILTTLRSPDLWLLSLKENADLLEDSYGHVDAVRMDRGEVAKWFGLELGHKHKRRNVGMSVWTGYNRRIANDALGAREDCAWFGYDVRR
jgi:hypothetical protein